MEIYRQENSEKRRVQGGGVFPFSFCTIAVGGGSNARCSMR